MSCARTPSSPRRSQGRVSTQLQWEGRHARPAAAGYQLLVLALLLLALLLLALLLPALLLPLLALLPDKSKLPDHMPRARLRLQSAPRHRWRAAAAPPLWAPLCCSWWVGWGEGLGGRAAWQGVRCGRGPLAGAMHARPGQHSGLKPSQDLIPTCILLRLAHLLQGDWKDLGALLAWFRWALPPPSPPPPPSAAPALQPVSQPAGPALRHCMGRSIMHQPPLPLHLPPPPLHQPPLPLHQPPLPPHKPLLPLTPGVQGGGEGRPPG